MTVRLVCGAVLLSLILSGCADYACAPARWSGYSCPSPRVAGRTP